MKKQITRSRVAPKPLPYPNAATARQKLEKAVDFLLTLAISVGLTVTLLFLLTL